MNLSIIIPAYNEQQRLPLTLEKIFEYLAVHYQGEYEVIIADDGSTDETAEIVLNYSKRHPELRLARFADNRGRGAAIRDAVFQARGDYILETDADGSVNEHAIIDFLNYFHKHDDADMLTGSRLAPGSRVLTPQSLPRKILGYGFFFLTRIFFGWPIADRINSFKMYRRAAALDIYRHQFENRFLSKAEVVYVAEKRGWVVRELPILWTEHSGSKVRPLADSWDSLTGLFRIMRRDRMGLYTRNLTAPERAVSRKQGRHEFASVLITGGSGFIGSNFVRYFYHNHPRSKIVNLDLLTYAGNEENLRDIAALEKFLPPAQRRYSFVQGDICDQSLLEDLFAGHHFDLVVHFAAESHVDRSIFNMGDFVRTNIEGTRILAETARRAGVKRFIHVSTDEVYGDIKSGYASEEWRLSPSNPYSASKAGADLLLQAYIRTHDMPAFIVRGSNNYGPFQYPEKLIPLAITNLLEGQKIPVHGYGIHVRSWLHVLDFCRAIDVIAHGNPMHRIYNVAGEEKTNHDVLDLIATRLGKNLADHRFHVGDRPGADHRYAVDAQRLEREFGKIYLHRPIEQEIFKVIEWYMDNRDWWQSLRRKEGFTIHYERQSKGQWS